MFPISGGLKIYYCRTPINLHRSFNGLPGAVQQYLHEDPLSGHLFVFFNRQFNPETPISQIADLLPHRMNGDD